MGIIKNVLREELRNSLKMEKGYKRELKNLPKGSPIKKKIKNQHYYYLVYREKGKVKFSYLGKISEKKLQEYEDIKKIRAKYRELNAQVKQRIKFLKRALHGKESV